MRNFLLSAALAVVAVPASAEVGVSISMGQPGFYGQIDIGDFPQPELIYSRPVIIEQRHTPGLPPIYLHVPPGYERHWKRHCHEYNACGRPVFFVRDRWYNDTYVRHYREHMMHREDRRQDRRFDRREDRREDRRDFGPGPGPR